MQIEEEQNYILELPNFQRLPSNEVAPPILLEEDQINQIPPPVLLEDEQVNQIPPLNPPNNKKLTNNKAEIKEALERVKNEKQRAAREQRESFKALKAENQRKLQEKRDELRNQILLKREKRFACQAQRKVPINSKALLQASQKQKALAEAQRKEKELAERNKQTTRLFTLLPYPEYLFETKECAICMSTTDENEVLSCGDSFCHSCIKLLLKDFLHTGRVFPDELVCPLCEKTIQDSDIQLFLGDFQFQHMLELREKFRTAKLVASGKAKHCPMSSCSGYIHIINGVVASACAVCRVAVCPTCMKCSHPTFTCEEYAATIGDTDQEFEEMMLSRNWKRCAFCSTMVEKADGCNFVKCLSSVCKNLDHAVCYLCGKGINERHHHSHFQKSGPFGNSCNTIDGIEDQPLVEEL